MANQCQEVVKCDFCPKPVSFSCRSCVDDLCEDCLPGHVRQPSRTGHDVVDLAKKNEDKSSFCESHLDQLCSTFCKTCDLPICNLCVSNEHNSHNLSKLSEKIEEVLTCINDQVQSFRQEIETILDPTVNQLSFLSTFYNKKKEDATFRKEDWLNQIDIFVRKLHEGLDYLEEKNEEKLQTQIEELRDMIEKTDEIKRKSAKLQKSKTLSERMKFRLVNAEQNVLNEFTQRRIPTSHECNIDGNDLQAYFEGIENKHLF